MVYIYTLNTFARLTITFRFFEMRRIYTPKTLWLAKPELDAICQPLNQFNISYFAHAHVDRNGNVSGLCNNPGYHEQYIINRLYDSDIHRSAKYAYGEFVIWDEFQGGTGKTKKLWEISNGFNLKHFFTIIDKTLTGIDYYHFATHLNMSSMNYTYLSNLDLLKLFILHFKENKNKSKTLLPIYDTALSHDPLSKGFTVLSNGEIYTNQEMNSIH